MKIIWGGGTKKGGANLICPLPLCTCTQWVLSSLPSCTFDWGKRFWKPQVREQRIHGTQSSDVSLVRVYDVHWDTEEKEPICFWDTRALG